MGEILGLGVTHQPTLGDEDFTPGSFRRTLANPELPEALRTPDGWPELLRSEWSDDEGKAAGVVHQDAVETEYKKITAALEEFNPDFIIVWGDDQYERFRENCIPTFCVVAADKFDITPWKDQRKPNLWGEAEDLKVTIPGNRAAAKWLIGELLARDFDVSYSYESEEELSHAFVKTALYLDWDRQGARFPMIPFALNCYGKLLTLTSGGPVPMSVLRGEGDFDPPAPSPKRCFDIGAAVAEIVKESPYRVALIASSSWSHGFLAAKNSFLFPDLESDRRLYDELEAGHYDSWRNVTTEEIDASGQQEMLNWFCLAGAMSTLGRTPDYISKVETALYNSNKVFAIYKDKGESAS